MKRLDLLLFAFLITLTFLNGCDITEEECGGIAFDGYSPAPLGFFLNPGKIYWGETNGVRSYTYNYSFENICTKQNPKVNFDVSLTQSNTALKRPISITAGVYTCLGVQPYQVVLTPNTQQTWYSVAPTEIGLQQCYGGQPVATIYPYITLSFNTLGSSKEDSLYLVENVNNLRSAVEYHFPK